MMFELQKRSEKTRDDNPLGTDYLPPESLAGKAPLDDENDESSACFASRLLDWFSRQQRDLPWRHTSNPYHIWVSEVMLQQTQVKTVIPYYREFLQRFPTVAELAQADLDSVLAVWRGLGYYARARHLWEGAQHVFSAWNGRVPSDYEALRQIPGVGEYTAGAIASIAFGQKVPALDGNVRRVAARLLAWPEPAAKASSQHRFREYLQLLQPVDRPGDFNQALMELGATLCTPHTPQCPGCPVSCSCQAFLTGNFNYPVRVPGKKPETLLRLTFVLLYQGSLYLQKRPDSGLLASLWEFPGLELPFPLPSAPFTRSVRPGSPHKSAVPNLPGRACSPGSPGPFDSSAPPDLCARSDAPLFSRAEWLAFYREVVTERTFDPEAERFFQGDFPVYGPERHTFSHLRWDLYWVVLDLESALRKPSAFPPRATSKLPTQDRADFLPPGASGPLLRETSPAWQAQTPSKNLRGSWVTPESLSEYALPSAFTAILRHLQTLSPASQP